MCGRFTLYSQIAELLLRFSLDQFSFPFYPSYNIAPTQNILTIRSEGQKQVPSLLRWGLVPTWQGESHRRTPVINARIETLEEKPSFRELVNSKRCLIIADGFYEWITENSTKHPVYITLEQGGPFAFAGLWQDNATPSCTIITQEAIPFLKRIHNRMPVILTPETEKLWLSSLPFSDLKELLPDQEKRTFTYHRVSTLVNSTKNNTKDCIAAVEKPQQLSLEFELEY